MTLKLFLESKGLRTVPVKYKAHGRVIHTGYDVLSKDGRQHAELEPQSGGVIFVSFHPPWDRHDGRTPLLCQHYARRREGFVPALCCPITQLKQDLLQYFGDGR